MAIHRIVDRNCPDCHGSGELSEGEVRDGEWWEMFHTCHCVTHRVDEDTKALIRAAMAINGAR